MEFSHNEEKSQFELHTEGQVAILQYEISNDCYKLFHTGVPRSLEGKGVGSLLVKQSLQEISVAGQKVIPTCPFIARYIERHQEWKHLLL